MPMPADTSETARLRRVSNQPVTVAIIGAKKALAASPTSTPKVSWKPSKRGRAAGQHQRETEQHRAGS